LGLSEVGLFYFSLFFQSLGLCFPCFLI